MEPNDTRQVAQEADAMRGREKDLKENHHFAEPTLARHRSYSTCLKSFLPDSLCCSLCISPQQMAWS